MQNKTGDFPFSVTPLLCMIDSYSDISETEEQSC